jgi:hypothetical protein
MTAAIKKSNIRALDHGILIRGINGQSQIRNWGEKTLLVSSMINIATNV